MERIEHLEDLPSLSDNLVLTSQGGNITMNSSQIVFKGKGNIVYLEDSVHLENCRISCEGDGNLVYLSSSKHKYFLNATLYNHSVFFMGKNNYLNARLNVILSEQKHILIGNDCLFSFGIWLRLADPI
ncbi:MAG: hypothetical protein Q4C50_08600 [Eubacteriales bacterium]|nr:hypothetical protein [Eubacteriales bacterium]